MRRNYLYCINPMWKVSRCPSKPPVSDSDMRQAVMPRSGYADGPMREYLDTICQNTDFTCSVYRARVYQ